MFWFVWTWATGSTLSALLLVLIVGRHERQFRREIRNGRRLPDGRCVGICPHMRN